MATVAITIDGVLWDKATKSGRAVRLEGQGFYSDLAVGGGPVYPPSGGGGGDPPHVDHTLPGDLPHPEHPIVTPPPGGGAPPIDPGADKPPPESGGWGWVADWAQWGYFPGPDAARPK